MLTLVLFLDVVRILMLIQITGRSKLLHAFDPVVVDVITVFEHPIVGSHVIFQFARKTKFSVTSRMCACVIHWTYPRFLFDTAWC